MSGWKIPNIYLMVKLQISPEHAQTGSSSVSKADDKRTLDLEGLHFTNSQPQDIPDRQDDHEDPTRGPWSLKKKSDFLRTWGMLQKRIEWDWQFIAIHSYSMQPAIISLQAFWKHVSCLWKRLVELNVAILMQFLKNGPQLCLQLTKRCHHGRLGQVWSSKRFTKTPLNSTMLNISIPFKGLWVKHVQN